MDKQAFQISGERPFFTGKSAAGGEVKEEKEEKKVCVGKTVCKYKAGA